jgi:CRISPR-associated protein Csm3
MKLKGYKNIQGIIEVITGLHIGGSTTVIEIGGKDNPVIKHPITKEPYIPGSSLKGKMRSLLEWRLGLIDDREKVNGQGNKDHGEVHRYNGPKCGGKTCPICVIFGTSADDAGLGPTRLVVRDAVLNGSFVNREKERNAAWTVLDLTEDKYENSINRITARANPRNFVRVVSGAEFCFSMSYRVFENGGDASVDEGLFTHVVEGLRLIERDALGGAGSRGCGQVRFRIEVGSGEWRELDQINFSDLDSLFPTKADIV